LKDRLGRLPFALKRALVEHQLLEETARLRASLLENETHSRELLGKFGLRNFSGGVRRHF